MMIEELIEKLFINKNNIGCIALEELLVLSEKSNEVYKYMDLFFSMLNNSDSFVRNRAIFLIGKNSKWDDKKIIDSNISLFLNHVTDEKPITSRQVLKVIPEIIKNIPAVEKTIIDYLEKVDISMYKDSMKSLIKRDIEKILNPLKNEELNVRI